MTVQEKSHSPLFHGKHEMLIINKVFITTSHGLMSFFPLIVDSERNHEVTGRSSSVKDLC